MKMIEEGMINLIKDYNIETTRSKIYKEGRDMQTIFWFLKI